MIKQRDIIKAVTKILKDNFGYKVYADEVVECFKPPCFFLKIIKNSSTETMNLIKNNISVIITFIAAAKSSLVYMDTEDKIQELFQLGFQLNSRYLSTKDINYQRVGEENDFLQAALDFEYYDSTNYDGDFGYDKIKKIFSRENETTDLIQ